MADTVVTPNNKAVAFQGAPTKEKSVVSDVMSRADQLLKQGLMTPTQHAALKAKAAKVA